MSLRRDYNFCLPLTLPTHTEEVDRRFKVDIIDPRTGDIGLQVGDIVQLERSIWTIYNPRRGSRNPPEYLYMPEKWRTLTDIKLNGIVSGLPDPGRLYRGLSDTRDDLTLPTDSPSYTLPAFIRGGPECPVVEGPPVRYTDLHHILADIFACQAVWYLHTRLGEDRRVIERLMNGRDRDDSRIWRRWKEVCGRSQEYLDALYVVSIRRLRRDNAWVYFPEVEIRGDIP